MPPRKGNGCSPQFPRDSVAAALAPPPLLKLTPHPLQGGHTLLPFHSIHRLPSKLLAQTMLSQGSSSFHACLPERHASIRESRAETRLGPSRRSPPGKAPLHFESMKIEDARFSRISVKMDRPSVMSRSFGAPF